MLISSSSSRHPADTTGVRRHNARGPAYDEIIAACDEFLTKGFTEERLKAFSRQTGTPPGWVHPRSDQRSQMEQDDPALVGKLTRAWDLIETLRTIGRWAE